MASAPQLVVQLQPLISPTKMTTPIEEEPPKHDVIYMAPYRT